VRLTADCDPENGAFLQNPVTHKKTKQAGIEQDLAVMAKA
jgi:hypothetical protein